VRAIPALGHPAPDHGRRRVLLVPHPAHLFEKVDQHGGQIEVLAELGGPVVPRERVVIVVPALAQPEHGHVNVFHGHYVTAHRVKTDENV